MASASPVKRDARRQADRERLEHAACELLTSDGWQRWIRVQKSVLIDRAPPDGSGAG